jgi:predicted kinase
MELMTGVRVAPRSLVVLGGLPGAGKTTMLATLETDGGAAVVLDSDQVRAGLRAAFPAGLPYRYYRPLVHLLHRLRVLCLAIGGTGLLVVHEPSTRPTTRAALVAVGALTGRHRHFLWLDSTVEEALAGQVARGRLVRGHAFARHARRAGYLRERFLDGWVPRGWHRSTVLCREDRLRLSVTPD